MPLSIDFNEGANWNTDTVPTGTAFFDTSLTTSLIFSEATVIGGWTFNAGASAYEFTNPNALGFAGAGIVVNGGSATIINNNGLLFRNNSTAGSATIVSNNNGSVEFLDNSTAGSATIVSSNNSVVFFAGTSTGAQAQFITNAGGVTDFSRSTGPASDSRLSAGSLAGAGSYYLGANELTVGGNNLSTDVSGVISDCGPTGNDCLNAGATGGSLVKTGTGTFTLSGANTFTGPLTVSAGTLDLQNGAAVRDTVAVSIDGGANLDVSTSERIGSLAGAGSANLAATQTLTTGGNNSSTTFSGVIGGAGALTKTGTGTFTLSGVNTFTGPLTVSAGTLRAGASNVFGTLSATTVAGSAALDLDGFDQTLGSLAGAGNVALGTGMLTTSGNNASTTFSGVIGGSGALTKTGAGTFTLSGANTYTGGTTVQQGTLSIDADANLGTGGTLALLDGSTVDLSANFTLAHATTVTGSATLNVETGLNPTISSAIANGGSTGQVVKSGAGILTLSGANTYTGGTTVQQGTLSIGADANLGTGGTLALLDGSAVDLSADFTLLHATTVTGSATVNVGAGLNPTISSAIADGGSAGQVVKSGAGALTLSGANTYTGGTTVRQGTLRLEDDNAAGTGTIITLGSVIDYADGVAIANPLTINSNTTQLQVTTGIATQAGNISETSGSRPLEKIGAGTLNLTGVNTFTGPLTVRAGTLRAGASDVFGTLSATTVAGDATLDLNGFNQTLGSLAGAGNTTLGTGALTTGGNNGSTTFSGVISGASGSLVKTGTGTFTLSGANTYTGPTTVNRGTLAVNGSVISSVAVRNGGTLGGSGTVGAVTVGNGGVVAPGNSIGTMTVSGAFKLAGGAVYEAEVNAAGRNDKVIVNGTVDLTGATLRVLGESGAYKPSTDYTIIDNDGTDAVVGEFAEVTNNLAFLFTTVDYNGGNGNDVVLNLTRNETLFRDVAATLNELAVAGVLDQFPTDSKLFLEILGLTAGEALQAFNALSGEIHASAAGVLADDSRYVREAILGRLMQASHTNGGGTQMALAAGGPQVASLDDQAFALGYDGKSLIDEPTGAPLAFWTRAFGAWGNFDTDGNAATADRDLGGFVSGMDASIGGSWRAGLATGASFSNIDVDARFSSANVESYYLGGYVGGMAGGFALRGGGTWAWSDIDTSRAVVFPGFFERQKASYDANTGQLFGEVAYPTQMGSMALEPFGGLAFVSVDTDSFRERGGPLASLRGVNTDQDLGYTSVGLRAATTMMLGSMQVVPHISAAWLHAFDDVTPGASLAFATTGIGFAVDGVPLAEDSALLDAGLDFALSENASAGFSYTGQFGDDVTDNGVKGRFTWLF